MLILVELINILIHLLFPYLRYNKYRYKCNTVRINQIHCMLSILDPKEAKTFYILKFWRMNERQYPTVSFIAHDLLTPLLSTIALEYALMHLIRFYLIKNQHSKKTY